MHDLIRIIMTWPWQLRVTIGHFLPLALSLGALWSLRRDILKPAVVGWLAFVAFGVGLTAATMKYGFIQNGQSLIPVSIQMPFHWMLTVMAAFAAYGAAAAGLKKLNACVVFPAVFIPLYALDIYGAVRMFPLNVLYQGIGGVGPLDVLFVSPCVAVVVTTVAVWETNRFPKTLAFLGRIKQKVIQCTSSTK